MEAEAASGGDWQAGAEALRQGRIEDAIAQLTEVVRRDPDSFEANNFLGVALAQSGQPRDAMYYLHKAVSLNSHSAQAHYNLGLAHLKAEQPDAAATDFKTALQIDPNHPQAGQALAGLTTADSATEAGGAAPSPWAAHSETSASSAFATQPAVKVTAGDYLKAAVFGFLAAVIGAFIWDKITYYTNFQIGIVAAGVGFGVGTAVSMGAGGKGALPLQIMGAILAGFGILLGQALINMDYLRDALTERRPGVTISPFTLFLIAVQYVPASLKDNFLTLVFIAFGVWEGWKIPGDAGLSHGAAQPVPAPSNDAAQDTAPKHNSPD